MSLVIASHFLVLFAYVCLLYTGSDVTLLVIISYPKPRSTRYYNVNWLCLLFTVIAIRSVYTQFNCTQTSDIRKHPTLELLKGNSSQNTVITYI